MMLHTEHRQIGLLWNHQHASSYKVAAQGTHCVQSYFSVPDIVPDVVLSRLFRATGFKVTVLLASEYNPPMPGSASFTDRPLLPDQL